MLLSYGATSFYCFSVSLVLHYDCRAGISGDMNLAALVNLGVPADYLMDELSKLPVNGYKISIDQASKNGIVGTQVNVMLEDETGHFHADDGMCNFTHDLHHGGHHHEEVVDELHLHLHHGEGEQQHHHEHRSFRDIEQMLLSSELKPNVVQIALSVFRKLAEAEGEVHGRQPEEVHFHEVGAIDSIVDIVGAAICLDYLKPDQITSTAVELGSGTVRCQHGVMTIPAPATAILAQDFPSSLGGTDHEATTPTGAALIATLVSQFSPHLQGDCLRTGIGIGHRDSTVLPNILRVFLYETDDEAVPDFNIQDAVEVHANIDDMTPEHLSFLQERLLEVGADDAWQEPIVMKKGRLATKVCALTSPQRLSAVQKTFFKYSSTLGLRIYPVCKYILPRDIYEVETPWGLVHVKETVLSDGTVRVKPEFDECRAIAQTYEIPLDEVITVVTSLVQIPTED